jgi:acyl-CoA synthetase (AMP-forming)/AMP-acid ligase II
MPAFYNLGDLIDSNQDLHKAAVIDLGGEAAPRTFAFETLDRMANGVARGLLARGLTRGERVALLAANRAEYLVAYYGIMRAGLVAVPVNFKLPPALIEVVLRDGDAQIALLICLSSLSATPGRKASGAFLTTVRSLQCSQPRQSLPCFYTRPAQLGSQRA